MSKERYQKFYFDNKNGYEQIIKKPFEPVVKKPEVRQLPPAEEKKENVANLALIALRRQNLRLTGESEHLRKKISHFNRIVKSKELLNVVSIIHYILRYDEDE